MTFSSPSPSTKTFGHARDGTGIAQPIGRTIALRLAQFRPTCRTPSHTLTPHYANYMMGDIHPQKVQYSRLSSRVPCSTTDSKLTAVVFPLWKESISAYSKPRSIITETLTTEPTRKEFQNAGGSLHDRVPMQTIVLATSPLPSCPHAI